jgi:hypothetical protein
VSEFRGRERYARGDRERAGYRNGHADRLLGKGVSRGSGPRPLVQAQRGNPSQPRGSFTIGRPPTAESGPRMSGAMVALRRVIGLSGLHSLVRPVVREFHTTWRSENDHQGLL